MAPIACIGYPGPAPTSPSGPVDLKWIGYLFVIAGAWVPLSDSCSNGTDGDATATAGFDCADELSAKCCPGERAHIPLWLLLSGDCLL